MDGKGRLSRALSTHGERVAASPMVPLQAAPPPSPASTVLMPWHSATVCIWFEYDGFREQRVCSLTSDSCLCPNRLVSTDSFYNKQTEHNCVSAVLLY